MSKAEAQETAPAAEGAEPEKKKSKLKLIIILVAVLLLGGLGAGLYMTGIIGGHKKEAEAEATGGEEHAEEAAKEPAKEEKAEEGHGEAEAGHGGAEGEKKPDAKKGSPKSPGGVSGTAPSGIVYYDMPDFLVNLNTGSNRSSFLKVSVTLELPNAEAVKAIEGYKPKIVDSFQTYLRELRPQDLQGSAGIYRLREELLLRVNKTVQPSQVNDILFKEMIVQ